MATREENLKKINEQLEKLDDEQLEQIAGGYSQWHNLDSIADGNPNTDPAENQPGIVGMRIR